MASCVLLAAAAAPVTAADSSVWAWGFNAEGQLGDGTILPGNTGRPLPGEVRLPAGVRFTTIAVGSNFEVALDQHGRAWSWGSNASGALGIDRPNPDAVRVPRRVRMPGDTTFSQVASGQSFTVALDGDGKLWGWGDGSAGQLGDGKSQSAVQVPSRSHMPSGVSFRAVAAGHDLFAAALDQHGDAWAWGNNDVGELGTGDTTAHTVPTRVQMPARVHFSQIAAGGLGGPGGGARVVALDTSGRVWGWGDNGTGDLGDGTTDNRNAPVEAQLPADVRIVQISAGGTTTLALDSTGQLWGWGEASAIGAGDIGASTTAVPVKAQQQPGTRFTRIAAGLSTAVALDQNGDAWTFGDNQVGELGNGTDPAQSSLVPVQVTMPAGVRWNAIAAGSTSSTLLGFMAVARARGVHLSTIASALMSPAEAFRPAGSMVVSAAVATGGALFITFPAQLFNSTLDENYEEIVGWWRRRTRRFRRRTDRRGERQDLTRSKGAFAAVLVLGGLLSSLLDPSFGHDWSSLTTFAGVLLSMGAGIAVSGLLTGAYHRVRHGSAPRYPHTLPFGLVIAAGCLLVSRMTGFQPGYMYGIVCAVGFDRELPKNESGHVVALSSLTAVAIGVTAWFAIVPINHYEASHGLSVGVVLMHNLLAGLFTGGIVSCVLGLLPLTFLPGDKLRQWNRGVWAAVFGSCLFVLVQVLLRPHTDHRSSAPLWTTIALFVAFGAVSVGFRHYFVRRNRAARGDPPPRLRDTLGELLPGARPKPTVPRAV